MTTQTEPGLDAATLAAALATAQRGATVPYRLDDHEISALAAVAAAAVGLVTANVSASMTHTYRPPWYEYASRFDDYRCIGCGESDSIYSPGTVAHTADCPALRLDAALAALAGTGAA